MNLQLQDIKKAYGGKEVLKGCSFTFEKGKIYGLLGRNGAGKTTLFNCLTDELPADSGTAELIEETGARRPLVPSEVGYVFSTPILPDFLTGYEFIKFYMDINAARCTPGKTIDDYFDMRGTARRALSCAVLPFACGAWRCTMALWPRHCA